MKSSTRMRSSFSLTSNCKRNAICMLLKRSCCLSGLWPKAFPLPPVLRTGDPENSRSRSLGDNRPKPPGRYNEIRLVVALVGLAISFALLAFAQQKDTVDPQLLEQINATISKKYDEAVNNNDAAAVPRSTRRTRFLWRTQGRFTVGRPSRNGIQTCSSHGTPNTTSSL
jgi:hypothetical protein